MNDVASHPVPRETPSARAWRITQRIEELRGEERANLIRIVGVAMFYALEVVNHHGIAVGALRIGVIAGVDQHFHRAMTGVALAWTVIAVMVSIALRNRFFPRWLKYATTGADVALATVVLLIADGPQSALVAVYFPILALAALRFEPWLVHFATTATITSYLAVVLVVGQARPALGVPRYQSIVLLLALALVGLVLAYAVNAVRRISAEHAARLAPPRSPEDLP